MRLARLLFGLVLVGSILAGSNTAASAQSNTPVQYSVAPNSGSVQPGGTINIKLVMQTDVTIAGGSVHLNFDSSSYGGAFQSLSSSSLTLVDYKESFNDVLFICVNNSCPPGTYDIAVITIEAGTAGNATVGFAPKETFDPSLNMVQASGANAVFTITTSAPPSEPKPSGSTYTIPKDNGTGNTGGANSDNNTAMEPVQINNEQYMETVRQAEQPSGGSIPSEDENKESTSFWTGRNIALVGFGISIVSIITVLLIARLSGGPKWPKDPTGGMYNGPGAGPVVHG